MQSGNTSFECRVVSIYSELQVILELLELREVEVARAMLRQTELMLSMKQEQPGWFDLLANYSGFGKGSLS